MSAELRTDVGTALRSTIEAFLGHQTDDEGLARAVALLDEVRGALTGPDRPRYYERDLSDYTDADTAFRSYLDETPFGGGSHPVSPPGTLELLLDPEKPGVVGTVTAGRPYEGPARCMHGGFVAGLFDHFLGMAQNAYSRAHGTQVFAATRELTVRFHAPTPLDTELTFRAWVDDVDERTMHGEATCHAGDKRTASAEVVFAKLSADRILSKGEGGFSGSG